MNFRFVEITPKMAMRWLIKQGPNRKMNTALVNYLTDVIKSGRWIPENTNPIAIDEDRVLLDGQHRLQAIVNAGIPVSAWVAYHVPRGTVWSLVDTAGIRKFRTTQDAWRMAGIEGNMHHAAVAKILKFGFKRPPILAPDDLAKMVRPYWKGIDFAVETCNGVQRAFAPFKAVIARAYLADPSIERKEKLQRFVQVYRTELVNTDRENAAVVLNKALRGLSFATYARCPKTSRYKNLTQIAYVYWATEICLTAFLAGRPIERLRLPRKPVEQYPLK